MSSSTGRAVRRRQVFYIPGYDPIHPRRYRELYRAEAAAQADVSGHDIHLSPKQGGGRYGWHVSATIEDMAVTADFDVLVWSDIVRDSMERGIPGTYLQLLRTAWTYIVSGALFRLMRLRKGPVIAALYPVGFLLVQLVLSICAGYLAGRALLWAWGAVACPRDCMLPANGPVAGTAATLLGLGTIWVVLSWFKSKDNKFFAYYLMHDYAYSARHRGANPAELEARMAEFSSEISAALRQDVDEVLVVGHSSGAHLAVSCLSDLIRGEKVPENGPALSFLSLGQVVPMVSFLPDANRLRADLHFLAARDEVTWIDVTAPGDGCAFALCDPVAVTGVAPQDKRWPVVISAAFTRTLSPERWRALRWRFFRLHFQYLCAFDQPGDYDYFLITAGPRTLADRFNGRQSSPSRIETPVSGYTDITV